MLRSVKCYSTAYFYEVSNSLKYFTTLRSFSSVLGITLHMQCGGVSCYSMAYFYEVSNSLKYFKMLRSFSSVLDVILHMQYCGELNTSVYGYADLLHLQINNKYSF